MTKNINSTLNATGNVDFFTAYYGLSVRVASFSAVYSARKKFRLSMMEKSQNSRIPW